MSSPTSSYLRATQAAKDGGLGLRKAADLRLPAFLASRADAKGLAELLTLTMPNGIKDNLFRYWGHTSTSAIEEWNETIPSSTGQVAEAILSEADAQSRARAGATSSKPTRPNNAIGDARLASRVKEAIISAAGLEDPEHPSNAGIGTQSRLTDLTAALALEHLNDHLRATNQHADVELLRDLRDPGTDHGWMWALASADASIHDQQGVCTGRQTADRGGCRGPRVKVQQVRHDNGPQGQTRARLPKERLGYPRRGTTSSATHSLGSHPSATPEQLPRPLAWSSSNPIHQASRRTHDRRVRAPNSTRRSRQLPPRRGRRAQTPPPTP